MILSPIVSRFVLHWGEMGTRWGVNRTVAQIHALLFAMGRPMHADEIVETLAVARSNVSTSLRELQGWKLVRMVHVDFDRRDHFETSTDVWELMRIVVRERQLREIAPTVDVLRELLADPAIKAEPAAVRLRLLATLELVDTLTAWSDEMLKLDSQTLAQVLRLGARIKKLIRPAGSAPAASPPASSADPAGLLGP